MNMERSDTMLQEHPLIPQEAVLPVEELVVQAREVSDQFIAKRFKQHAPEYINEYPGFFTNLYGLRDLYLTTITAPRHGETLPQLDIVGVNQNIRRLVMSAMGNPTKISEMIEEQQAMLDAKLMTPEEIYEFIAKSTPVLFDQFKGVESDKEGTPPQESLLPVSFYDYEQDTTELGQEKDESQAAEASDDDYQRRLRLSRHARKTRGKLDTAMQAFGLKPLEREEEVVERLVQDLEDADAAIKAKIEGDKLDPTNSIHKKVGTIPAKVLIEYQESMKEEDPMPIPVMPTGETRVEESKGKVHKGHGTFNVVFGSK